jgi:hypothetical protein
MRCNIVIDRYQPFIPIMNLGAHLHHRGPIWVYLRYKRSLVVTKAENALPRFIGALIFEATSSICDSRESTCERLGCPQVSNTN